MNLKLKERVVIQFLVKEDCIPKGYHNRLRNVYEGAVIDINNVLYCVKKTGNGETEVTDKDKLRSDRPTAAVRDANRERADELVRGHRRVTVENADALIDSYGSA